MSKSKSEIEDIEKVVKAHPVLGNFIRVYKISHEKYMVITDKVTGTIQKSDGFYYFAYTVDADYDGWDDSIGIYVLTEKTLVRHIQTHCPARTLEHWDQEMEQRSGPELEESLLQSYSILRQIQRKR